jgi:hypothetical protein
MIKNPQKKRLSKTWRRYPDIKGVISVREIDLIEKTIKTPTKMKEPISPTKRKELRKQKESQKTKQYLTYDFAYTGIPGAKATAKGVKYRVK